MAEPTKQTICQGCSKRSDNRSHCVYPSNPAVNAAHPVKRDSKSSLPVCVKRRARAQSIVAQNTLG